MGERTVSMIFVRSALLALGAAGVDTAALAARLAIPADELADPEARVALGVYYRLWRDGPELTGDPSFGLHAGQMLPLGAYDVLDYILRSSPNVGEAIAKTMRYFRIMSEAADLSLEVVGSRAALRQRLARDRDGVPRHIGECFLSLIVARYRSVVGSEWPLDRVAFMHARPVDVAEHRRIFGTDVFFDRDANALEFDAALLAQPFATADPRLNDLLARQAERMLRELPQGDTFAHRAREAAARVASDGAFSVDALAAKLRLSRRTLQRKLRSENLSADGLIDDARRALALRYLEERRLAFAEVAALVGFSELSAFYRAFRRWTGTTPKRYVTSS